MRPGSWKWTGTAESISFLPAGSAHLRRLDIGRASGRRRPLCLKRRVFRFSARYDAPRFHRRARASGWGAGGLVCTCRRSAVDRRGDPAAANATVMPTLKDLLPSQSPLSLRDSKGTALERACGDNGDRIVFPSTRRGPLSADGATYILLQGVRRALPACPTPKAKRISPHVIRHTKAMHLLQSGVEIAVIALWLGHESLDRTHMFIQADLKAKEQALGKLQPVEGGFPRFKPDDALLAFVSAL
jgi:hypothetical protein